MEDIVLQAMAKWPNVPDCYGWLGLDSRGHWYLRDADAQAEGSFPQSKGSQLRHDKLLGFIARNYASDVQGRWYFQNGPQRVYVELECTPWVWRVGPELLLESQTGQTAHATACLLDAEGRVYLDTPMGLGLVHSSDTGLVADTIEQGVWQTRQVEAEQLPMLYGFVRSPQTAPEVVR